MAGKLTNIYAGGKKPPAKGGFSMIQYFNGVPVSIPNTITTESQSENYYVSYNPSRRDYGIDTTALVITIGNNERQVFYILKGNHTGQYAGCKDLNTCLKYYEDNAELRHRFSDSFEHTVTELPNC